MLDGTSYVSIQQNGGRWSLIDLFLCDEMCDDGAYKHQIKSLAVRVTVSLGFRIARVMRKNLVMKGLGCDGMGWCKDAL